MIDVKLDTFLALCKTRSYTQTAQLVNITQPAVSQHIKQLEKYYDAKLFYYDEKRQLHLTDKGKRLRDFAQSICSDSALFLEEMRTIPQENMLMKIGTLKTLGESIAPQIIAEYIKKYPDQRVSLYLGESDILFTWLNEGRIQCCITDSFCSSEIYESHKLFEMDTICVCAPSHPLAGKTVDFSELINNRLIFRENDTYSHRNLMNILHENNQELLSFASYVEVGSINAVKKLVMENIGISFIYRFVVQDDIEQGLLDEIHIKGFSSRNIFSFAWMKDSFYTAPNKNILEICNEVIND